MLYNRRHCVILSNRKNFFEDQILAELKAHVCYYLISPVLSRITTMCCFTPRSIHYAIEFFFSFSFYCTIHTYIHTHTPMYDIIPLLLYSLLSADQCAHQNWSFETSSGTFWMCSNIKSHSLCIFYVRMNWMRGYEHERAWSRVRLVNKITMTLVTFIRMKMNDLLRMWFMNNFEKKKKAAMRCMDAK